MFSYIKNIILGAPQTSQEKIENFEKELQTKLKDDSDLIEEIKSLLKEGKNELNAFFKTNFTDACKEIFNSNLNKNKITFLAEMSFMAPEDIFKPLFNNVKTAILSLDMDVLENQALIEHFVKVFGSIKNEAITDFATLIQANGKKDAKEQGIKILNDFLVALLEKFKNKNLTEKQLEFFTEKLKENFVKINNIEILKKSIAYKIDENHFENLLCQADYPILIELQYFLNYNAETFITENSIDPNKFTSTKNLVTKQIEFRKSNALVTEDYLNNMHSDMYAVKKDIKNIKEQVKNNSKEISGQINNLTNTINTHRADVDRAIRDNNDILKSDINKDITRINQSINNIENTYATQNSLNTSHANIINTLNGYVAKSEINDIKNTFKSEVKKEIKEDLGDMSVYATNTDIDNVNNNIQEVKKDIKQAKENEIEKNKNIKNKFEESKQISSRNKIISFMTSLLAPALNNGLNFVLENAYKLKDMKDVSKFTPILGVVVNFSIDLFSSNKENNTIFRNIFERSVEVAGYFITAALISSLAITGTPLFMMSANIICGFLINSVMKNTFVDNGFDVIFNNTQTASYVDIVEKSRAAKPATPTVTP